MIYLCLYQVCRYGLDVVYVYGKRSEMSVDL